jgi:putative transposase
MSRPPRVKSFSYIGQHRYFLTICTFNRRSEFTDAETVDMVWAHFRRFSQRDEIAINAYCAMPDHFHLLATGLSDTSNVRNFIAHSKQRSGWALREKFGRRLWQEGYYDRVLRDEDDTAAVIRYIVNNPIRAGLVVSPATYPFWGSFTHTRDEILEFIERAPEWKPPP